MRVRGAIAILGIACSICLSSPAIGQQRFSYPSHVVEKFQQDERAKEADWRKCFGIGLAQRSGIPGADWRTVAGVFRACEREEQRYVRAALEAAQRENPEPRTDQYGRIVAWDKLGNFYRYRRRDQWLRIRHDLEADAARVLKLQPRCEWRYTNYATRGANYCVVSDSEMGMFVFDREQLPSDAPPGPSRKQWNRFRM